MSTAEARHTPKRSPAADVTGEGAAAAAIESAGPARQRGARRMVVTNWPMWVVGLTLFVDGMDQYIVRGSSNQIKAAFGVGDTAIGLLFSAFILVNGIVTLPAGYLADRWNRTRAMAVTIVAVVAHQRAGRPGAHRRLRPAGRDPGLARLRAGGDRPVRQQRHRRLLRDRTPRAGLLHSAVPELRRARHGPGHRRRPRAALPRPGLARRLLRLALPRPAWWRTSAGGCPSRAAARRTGPT